MTTETAWKFESGQGIENQTLSRSLHLPAIAFGCTAKFGVEVRETDQKLARKFPKFGEIRKTGRKTQAWTATSKRSLASRSQWAYAAKSSVAPKHG